MLNLTNKTAKEKAQLKSIELAKVKISKFKKGDFDIEIIGDIKEIEVNGVNGIELFATAKKNGKPCGFGKDGSIDIERFRFFNPPILVDDENGDIIEERTNPITKEKFQRKLKYDPKQAIIESLTHTILQVAKDDKNIVKGKIGNTTSTFYPSVDGWAKWSGSTASWGTARGSSGNDSSSTATELFAQLKWNSSWIEMERGITVFNTSAIPNTDTITSATYSIQGLAGSSVSSGFLDSVAVVKPTTSSTSSLTPSDYNIGNWATTQLATNKTISTISTSYNNFALNASGISNISKTGFSYFGIMCENDRANTDPSLGAGFFYSLAYFKSDNTAGTSSDPKLVVEHSAPSSIKSINGLAKASIKSRNGLAIASIKSINGLE